MHATQIQHFFLKISINERYLERTVDATLNNSTHTKKCASFCTKNT